MQRHRKSVHLQQFQRVIDKYGNKNVYFKKVPQKSKRYFSDIVTTIVSISPHNANINLLYHCNP